MSYNEKHNEANGENNQDGESHNRSWNCGVEGPTNDAAVNELRARQQRNFIATLLLSQGIPMIVGGDEIGRTQHGNNNAYCQDNEVSWFDIAWLRTDGEEMSEEDWQTGFAKSLMVFLNGDGVIDVDENGKRVPDASFLLLFNAHHEPLDFTLPPGMFGNKWSVVLVTGTEMGEGDGVFAAGATVPVQGRSIIVLSRP